MPGHGRELFIGRTCSLLAIRASIRVLRVDSTRGYDERIYRQHELLV